MRPRLIRWILLPQEFDLEICDKKGSEKIVAYHLSRLESSKETEVQLINEDVPDERLYAVKTDDVPRYADFVSYLASNVIPPELNYQQKK